MAKKQNERVIKFKAVLDAKGIISDIKSTVSDAEKKGKIQFTADDKEIQASIKKLMDMVDSDLKGINLTRQFKQLADFLSEPVRELDKFKTLISGLEDDFQGIYEISKKTKNADLFNSKQLDNLLEVYAKIGEAKKSLEKGRAAAEESAKKIRSKNGLSFEEEKLKDTMKKYGVEYGKGTEVGAALGLADDKTKEVLLDLRKYKVLVDLYQKFKREVSFVDKPTDTKEAEKKLVFLSEQYSVIKEIEKIEKNLIENYGVKNEKLLSKTELDGATSKSDSGKANHARSQYIKNYTSNYEKRITKAQENFDTQVQKFSERIAERAGKNIDSISERYEKATDNLNKAMVSASGGSGNTVGSNVVSDDDINNLAKYLVDLDECIIKINDLQKEADIAKKTGDSDAAKKIFEEQYKYYTRMLDFDPANRDSKRINPKFYDKLSVYPVKELSESTKTMVDEIKVRADNKTGTVGTKVDEVTAEIDAATDSLSGLLSYVSKLSSSLIDSGEKMEDQVALLDNYGKVLTKKTGDRDVFSSDVDSTARKLFQTHFFDKNMDNLNFSNSEIKDFFEKAVPSKVTESVLYCGDRLLSLNVSKVPSEKMGELKDALMNNYLSVMSQFGGAEFDDGIGAFKITETDTDKLGKAYKKEFASRINAVMKNTVESFGGTLTSQKYPSQEFDSSSFTASIIDVQEAIAMSKKGLSADEIGDINGYFLDLRDNFDKLGESLESLNLPEEDLYQLAKAVTDSGVATDDLSKTVDEIQAKLSKGLLIENIVSDLERVQDQAEATKNSVEKAKETVVADTKDESKQTESGAVSSKQQIIDVGATSKDVSEIQKEIISFKELNNAVEKVESSVDEKSASVKSEEDIVHNAVTSEVSYFEKLRDMIDNVSGSLYSFLSSDDAADSNELPKLHESLESILEIVGKINDANLSESLFDQFKNIPSFDKLNDFMDAVLAFKKAMENIDSLANGKGVFDSFKISKASVENIADLATALDLIKDSLDGFGPEARNALSSLEVIAKNTNIFQQLKTPNQNSSESSGKPKQPVTMEDTIRDAWKKAELEDIRRTEDAYDSLINKLTKYANLVSKKASGKHFTTQETKDFANLSEQLDKAINKQGIYATTTAQAEAANKRFNTELEKMKQLYSETAIAKYEKRFGNFKSQENDKIPEYAVTLKEMEGSLGRLKKLSPVDLFDEAAMKEYAREVESFEKLAADLKSKKYNFIPDDRKHTAISNFETWANQNTAALKQYGDEIARVRSLFNNVVSSADLNEATSAFKRLQAEVNRTGKVGKSFADTWKSRMQNLGVYLSTFVSFYDAIGVLHQGFDIIKDYDTALTEMQKVSDASYRSLRDFQEASFALGDSVGSTGKQIQNSTADFLRLGELFEEAKKSAVDANTLFKVSEFGSIEEATDAMISMSQAYKELEKSEINDILNNVGNNFSISTEGLASALQTSAAALKVAGNDINEAVTLITAGNAIVQDPSQVGAGMRTISLRILGTEQAKDELASLGEDIDDFVVQTASKIDETVKAYTAVASNQFKGVSLLDENGNYRDTYAILQDIADVYQEILETDKKAGTNRGQALVELLAGKNRANIAASILSNPDLLRDVYETSLDSAGSAQAELDKYLESIEAHLEKVRNQWESIWITDNNREIINFFLDATAAVLQFTEAVGLLPIASGFGGIAAFVKNFGRSVKDCIKLPKFFMLAEYR